jgi:pyruvate/2-oxoglutarate dehydrogenase complex dihydrolipoamide dehydrogenase (E3) component
LLSAKYAVNVATSGGMGQDRQVTEYLDTIMLNFGCFISGSVGTSIQLGSKALENAESKAFQLGEKLVRDIRRKKIYKRQQRVQEANREYFRDLVRMNKDEWVHEYEFWKRIEGGKGKTKPWK